MILANHIFIEPSLDFRWAEKVETRFLRFRHLRLFLELAIDDRLAHVYARVTDVYAGWTRDHLTNFVMRLSAETAERHLA